MKGTRRCCSMSIVLGAVAGIFLALFINGTPSAEGAFDRLLAGLGGFSHRLSDHNKFELSRFEKAFVVRVEDPEEASRKMAAFTEVYNYVLANYVRPVNDYDLIDNALAGLDRAFADTDTQRKEKSADILLDASLQSMLAGLDPHSSYLDPNLADEMRLRTRGRFGGLGIEVTMDEKGVQVVAPIADTPAERAGIKPGDLITHIDGRSLAGWNLFKAVDEMRGKPGTAIQLTVNRTGQGNFKVRIVRDIIKIQSVRWRQEGRVGYMRVVSFSEKMERDMKQAFKQMHEKMGDDLAGVVLDLRGNPGGLLDQSVALADAFLDDGVIVSVRSRTRRMGDRDYSADHGDLTGGKPVIVLIDEGSASASEIVAGALQDHHRAIVMGSRSFGKGSVQTLNPLGNNGLLRLTTALYFTASGRSIQAEGVVPDIEIRNGAARADKKRDEKVSVPGHESDLPNALRVNTVTHKEAAKSIDRKSCTPVERGKIKDYVLGCALDLLAAGSTEQFLTSRVAE